MKDGKDGKDRKSIVTEKELEHIAALARIELEEDEREAFRHELSAILQYFGMLDKVETEIAPMHHVFDLINVFRDDKREMSFEQEEALKNTPKKEEGYVKAPRIV